MTFGIFPMPAWVSLAPIRLVTTADAGAAISGVADGDFIVGVWRNTSTTTPPATPSGYTSMASGSYSAGGRGISYRIAKKVASSESGTWPQETSSTAGCVMVYRNATTHDKISAFTGHTDSGDSDFNISSTTPAFSGYNIIALFGWTTSSIEAGAPTGYTLVNGDTAGTSPIPSVQIFHRKISPGATGNIDIDLAVTASTTDPVGGIMFNIY